MVVKLDRARGVWFVASFVDDHNHAMARPDEVPFLWSHRRIGDGTRAEILAMQGAGIRKHIIVDNFISRYVHTTNADLLGGTCTIFAAERR